MVEFARTGAARPAIALAVLLLVAVGALPAGAQEPSNEEPSNAEVSLDYYRELAIRSHPYAQLSLADIYRHGQGVPRDPVEAYAWYAVAAEQGVQEAVEPMEAVLDGLEADQRRAARERAAEYRRRFLP